MGIVRRPMMMTKSSKNAAPATLKKIFTHVLLPPHTKKTRRAQSTQQKTLSTNERVANWFRRRLLRRPHHIARLESFGAFEQIELDRLSFVQRAVAVLLNGGEVHEHVLTRGALDEPVTLRPVEPLHSTLLSHKNSFRLGRQNYSCASSAFVPRAAHEACMMSCEKRNSPLKGARIRWHYQAASRARQQKRLPAFRRAMARDEKQWSREDEGAISTTHTETSTVLLESPACCSRRSPR